MHNFATDGLGVEIQVVFKSLTMITSCGIVAFNAMLRQLSTGGGYREGLRLVFSAASQTATKFPERGNRRNAELEGG